MYLLLVTLIGCSSGVEDSSGFIIIDDKPGQSIQEDDFLSLVYVASTESGRLVFSSYDYDIRPTLMFQERPRFKDDFFTALGELSEGDSAEFKVSVDSLKKTKQIKQGAGEKYLFYSVRINKVISRGTKSDSLFNAAVEEYKLSENQHHRAVEEEKIREYISIKKLKPRTTLSGLHYLLTRPGTGRTAAINDTVVVNYTARGLTGKIFETTVKDSALEKGIFKEHIRYKPLYIKLTDSDFQSGFREALTLFTKGAKATLIIPSKLAYSGGLYRDLKPYTPILCELEVVDIIKPRGLPQSD